MGEDAKTAVPGGSGPKRAKGLRQNKINRPPTTPEKAPWFDRYGIWLALTPDEKRAMFPDIEIKDPKTGKVEMTQRVKDGTDQEFAKIAGVHTDTLTNWKHKKELWAIHDEHMNLDLRKLYAPVMRGLARNAIAHGRANDVKAFIELVVKPDANADAGIDDYADLLKKYE